MKLGKAEGRVVSTALESTNPESQAPFVSGFGFLGCNGMGDGPRASILDRPLGRSVGEWWGGGRQRKTAGGKMGSHLASRKVARPSLTVGRTV